MQCIPRRDMFEARVLWLTQIYTSRGGPKCLWEQLWQNRCKLYPPERNLANQPSLNLEGGAQGKISPHQKIPSP